jgi:hypothetical protein
MVTKRCIISKNLKLRHFDIYTRTELSNKNLYFVDYSWSTVTGLMEGLLHKYKKKL